MSHNFDPARHICLRYSDLQKNGREHAAFETWITGMTMERDGEYGQDRIVNGETIDGFWTWIQKHHVDPDFLASGLFGTFIWFHIETKVPVATGTIAPDDRGIKALYGLGGDGFWGGVNVRHDLRGRGLGRKVVGELDDHVARFARREPKLFHLYTANEVAEQMYIKRGYERNAISDVYIDAFGGERLYSKHYGV